MSRKITNDKKPRGREPDPADTQNRSTTRMRRTLTDQERVAYHEAGHAVLAHFTGFGCESISIVATDDSSGRFSAKALAERLDGALDLTDAEERRVVDALMVILGGLAAELAVGGKADYEAGHDDRTRATFLASSISADEHATAALLESSLKKATRRLQTPGMRQSLEAVAKALIERKELTGSELGALMGGTVQQ